MDADDLIRMYEKGFADAQSLVTFENDAMNTKFFFVKQLDFNNYTYAQRINNNDLTSILKILEEAGYKIKDHETKSVGPREEVIYGGEGERENIEKYSFVDENNSLEVICFTDLTTWNLENTKRGDFLKLNLKPVVIYKGNMKGLERIMKLVKEVESKDISQLILKS